MDATTDLVKDHYRAGTSGGEKLIERIAAAVDAMGPPLDLARLAPLDQLHRGGWAATVALANRVGISSGDLVLDAGSGLGGPARYLAQTFGCRVEGVDLSPDYIAAARNLNDRLGLSDRVTFEEGNLLSLAAEDARYDLVWSLHVAMNIHERNALYRELRRVLKLGGRFAFYDPMAAEGHADVIYPLPWAETPATSRLLTLLETRTMIEAAGFRIEWLEDATEEATGWARASEAMRREEDPTLALVLGERVEGMWENLIRNVREGRLKHGIGLAISI